MSAGVSIASGTKAGDKAPATDAEQENKDGEEAESKDGEAAENEDGENAEAKDGENAEAKDGENAEAKDGENAEAKDGESAEAKDGDDAEKTEDENAGAETGGADADTVNWSKGEADLEFTFEHPVKSIFFVNTKADFGTAYYTLSEDGKKVSIHHDTLNNWRNGRYIFEFSFDGSDEVIRKTVSISGEIVVTPAPVQTEAPAETTSPTATPAPTATPRPSTIAPTGDNTPIALWVGILVLMAAALAVVIVLVVRKNKQKS